MAVLLDDLLEDDPVVEADVWWDRPLPLVPALVLLGAATTFWVAVIRLLVWWLA